MHTRVWRQERDPLPTMSLEIRIPSSSSVQFMALKNLKSLTNICSSMEMVSKTLLSLLKMPELFTNMRLLMVLPLFTLPNSFRMRMELLYFLQLKLTEKQLIPSSNEMATKEPFCQVSKLILPKKVLTLWLHLLNLSSLITSLVINLTSKWNLL